MSEIQRKINLIREQRETEAKKKKLYEKLSEIAKGLGSPILSSVENSGFFGFEEGDANFGMSFSSHDFTNPEPVQEGEIPRLPGEDFKIGNQDGDLAMIHGWNFDALKEGCNFEVYLCTDGEEELRASYNGYIVYHHHMGALRQYLPNDLWETKVDHWHKKAIPRLKIQTHIANEQTKEYNKSRLREIADTLKKLWGWDNDS